MATARRIGLMRQSTRDSIRLERSTERVCSCGRTIVLMRDSSSRITSTGLASMSGRMGASTRDNGRTTRWREREYLLGSTVVSTRENTRTTRRKDLVFSRSEMGGCMKGNGRTASSMAKVFSRRKTFRGRVFGRMDSVWSG